MALVSKILEATLTAGSTTVTFTDSDIPNSLIRVFSSNPDIIPESRTLIGNTLTVVYPAQSNNMGVAVEIVKQGLDIVDDLTSTDTDKALSAKQGKMLNDDITNLSSIIQALDIPEKITDLSDVNISDIQTGQVLAWDGAKFVNINQSGGGNTYTTDEITIGTWIDGSTIYRKVFTGLSVTQNGTAWVNITSVLGLGIKYVINAHAYFTINANRILSCGMSEYSYDNNIGLQINATQGLSRTIDILVLEYTKTT